MGGYQPMVGRGMSSTDPARSRVLHEAARRAAREDDMTVGEFVAGVGDRLVSWNRAVAPLWFWMGIVWGWLALATSVRELFLTHWFVAAVQIVVAGVLLLGLPFGRAYVRRRRYHAGLLARADEAMGKGA